MKSAVFWMTWLMLFGGSMLTAIAVNDYSNREVKRFEAAHLKGMAEGSVLCGGRP
ncbi:hypothetical protein [Variovorax boronicumulans]|uniref:hypothetical protein n=1 Tax=Variovorax boronicumulans TaxID=436515 RepID=UPI001C581ACA